MGTQQGCCPHTSAPLSMLLPRPKADPQPLLGPVFTLPQPSSQDVTVLYQDCLPYRATLSLLCSPRSQVKTSEASWLERGDR